MLRFLWNGIKGSDGKLQRCYYNDGQLSQWPVGTITIYGRDYCRFSAEVCEVFTVVNDSDMTTNYFENDRIRVAPEHPLYAPVSAAMAAHKAHFARREREGLR